MLELDKTYNSARVLRFMAQHGVAITPINRYGSSYSGCEVRQLRIETHGDSYAPGNVYSLAKCAGGWKVTDARPVPKQQYEKASAERRLEDAMQGVYRSLIAYDQYRKQYELPKT